jgi:hypothetical protein
VPWPGAFAGPNGSCDRDQGPSRNIQPDVVQRWRCGSRVAESDPVQCDRHRPGGNSRRCRRRLLESGDVTGPEGGPRRLAGERRWGSQEGTQPRVGGGAALDGVDHLGHPKATVDEAQIEFQIGDEGPQSWRR